MSKHLPGIIITISTLLTGNNFIHKIQKARNDYQAKFGKAPNLVQVHPFAIPCEWSLELPAGVKQIKNHIYLINGCEMRANCSLSRRSVWLGFKD